MAVRSGVVLPRLTEVGRLRGQSKSIRDVQ